MNNLTAIIDADGILYKCASSGEKRTIVVTHKNTKEQWAADNRTAFWGTNALKNEGILAEINKGRDSPFMWDEFEIEDLQEAPPLSNILHTTKITFNKWLETLGTKKYQAYVSGSTNFRVERSTLLEYKGQRKFLVKPIHLEATKTYLMERFKCERVEGIEPDDVCVIEAYRKPNKVIMTYDKDAWGVPCNVLSMTKPEEGVLNCNQFGKLWLDGEGKVRGIGRMFLYLQVASGDLADNYKANCFSDVRWAEKSAYNALVGAVDDKDALTRLVGVYKTLYPEPKKVIGWRGNEIDLNWEYVAQENFTMARMLKFRNEPEILLTDVFDRLGVEYGDNK